MRLNINKSDRIPKLDEEKIIEKREDVDTDENILFKEYMQSFLKWLYIQNNDFCSTLKNEEISTYFMQSLIHPLWFTILLDKNKFKMMAAIDSYINKYKENASIFRERKQIVPIEQLDYFPTFDTKNEKKPTPKQLYFLKSLMNSHNYESPVDTLSMKEVSLLINLLKSTPVNKIC